MSKSKVRDLMEFLLLFIALYFLTQFALRHFFPDTFGNGGQKTGVVLSMQDATVKGGHHPIAYLANYTEEPLVLTDSCPMPPLTVEWKDGEEFKLLQTEETVLPCEVLPAIEPGKKEKIDLGPWKYSLFSEFGTYKLTFPSEGEEELSTEFTLYPVGSITRGFRAFITKPFLNLLVFIASWMPGYNLGLAVIILTLIVKIVLFFPTQHGLQGQRKLQAVQPKLDALKQKYKGDPQRLQKETMKIWKEHKVNPFQSCLPILIQFPILIGLFYVIRDGATLELSRHLLYDVSSNLSWSFGTNFLGINLLEPNVWVMPPLLVIMQFTQMKLSFAIAKKKKKAKESKPSKKDAQKESAQQTQQKVMLYGLPIMIGFFALQFPAAVSLYWGVSTVFAIGQQLVVNRKEL